MTQAANLAALGTNAGTTGILPIAGGGTAGTNGAIGFKNRIINGAMVIDQRNAGASSTNATYTLDRWGNANSVSSKFSVQQNAGSVTPPVGFTNYLGVTSTSAYSVGADDYFLIGQSIEGYNIADLGWGTADAKTVTLSFWVRSSLTGTFSGCLHNSDSNRWYVYSYTISSANTWEQKSITITGPTSGTWATNNGLGIKLYFTFGVGSTYSGTAGSWGSTVYLGATGQTSVVGTSGATWYMTGAQLEVGTAATNFDVRSYGTELALCQRYYEKSYSDGVVPATGTALGAVILTVNGQPSGYLVGSRPFIVQKRAAPSVTIYSVSGTAGTVSNGDTADYGAGAANQVGTNSFGLQNTSGSNYTPSAYTIYFHFTASAEI